MVNPGESKGIPCYQNQDQDHNQNHDQDQNKASATPADAGETAAIFLTFPTIAGKNNKNRQWDLREQDVKSLIETFVGVDVRAECRKALRWVESNPVNKKTATGMQSFLFRWMARVQNQGTSYGRSNRNGAARKEFESNLPVGSRKF